MKKQKAVYTTNGCSSHSTHDRQEEDYYATNPVDVQRLFDECKIEFSKDILEPCAGGGHIAKVFKERGFNVTAKDLVQRDYPLDGTWDFLAQDEKFNGDIVTNPPYNLACECVEKALDMIPEGHRVVMLLKLTFLESKKRKRLFDTMQLKTVYVFRNRTACAMNGNEKEFGTGAVAYAWYEWVKGYRGDPVIKWIYDDPVDGGLMEFCK